MITYVFFMLVLFYVLFYKEILATYYLLFVIFVIKLTFILIYYYQNEYVGLMDDFTYYKHGKALLIYTPEQLLFSNAINLLFMLSGSHFLYTFLNHCVYYFFGDNIMNMLLFNLFVFVMIGYFGKKIYSDVFNASRCIPVFCIIYFLYPDMWAFGYLNLKDFVVALLLAIQIYCTLVISKPNGKVYNKVFCFIFIVLTLFLLLFIRYYTILLYLLSVTLWMTYKYYDWKFTKIQLAFAIVFTPFIIGFYDFAISPFFLTVNPSYQFLQIPALINWFLLYPILLLGLIKLIKDNNKKAMLLVFYMNCTCAFYAILGFSVGISGPRQRVFVEFIYVILITYGIKVIKDLVSDNADGHIIKIVN